MKRMVMLLIGVALSLSGCSIKKSESETFLVSGTNDGSVSEVVAGLDETIPDFSSLGDPALLDYLESDVYFDLVDEIGGDEYFVENVRAVYVSQEYLDDLRFNSQSNIYFGYTQTELSDLFQDSRFVFTLGENGETTVEEFIDSDDTYNRVIQNVAIGTGVILLCITVSSVATVAGAPAVSVIFAASAKTGTAVALESGLFSATVAGVVTGLQTRNVDETLKSMALQGSEGLKFGALFGSLTGGVQAITALKGATLNGLTLNEAASIQKQSKYPLDIVKQFRSKAEYDVYKSANLRPEVINGKNALIRNIDPDYISSLGGKQVTNLERMKQGYAPIEPLTGKAYQLHHVGQKSDGALAVLTEAEHLGNSSILNFVGKVSEIDRTAFTKERINFWIDYATKIIDGGI